MVSQIDLFNLTLTLSAVSRKVPQTHYHIYPDFVATHKRILPRNRATALEMLRKATYIEGAEDNTRNPFVDKWMPTEGLREYWKHHASIARALWV